MHFKPQRTKLFCGRVLDGPLEGDWIEDDSMYFESAYTGRTPLTSYGDFTATSGVFIDRVIYKWLPGYRAWAWVQPEGKRK